MDDHSGTLALRNICQHVWCTSRYLHRRSLLFFNELTSARGARNIKIERHPVRNCWAPQMFTKPIYVYVYSIVVVFGWDTSRYLHRRTSDMSTYVSRVLSRYRNLVLDRWLFVHKANLQLVPSEGFKSIQDNKNLVLENHSTKKNPRIINLVLDQWLFVHKANLQLVPSGCFNSIQDRKNPVWISSDRKILSGKKTGVISKLACINMYDNTHLIFQCINYA